MKQIATVLMAVLVALCLAQMAQAQGRNCLLPGDTVEVPTPGYLRNATPNIKVRTEGGLVSVTLLSFTVSRMQIRLPSVGLPYNEPIKFVHVESNGREKVVANARMCADPAAGTGDGDGGGGGGGTPGTAPGQQGDQTAPGANAAPGAQLRQGLLSRRGPVTIDRATRNDVAAPSGAPEYLLVGSARDISAAQVVLAQRGVVILRNVSLGSLNLGMVAVDLNGQITLAQVRSLLAQRGISATVDRHAVYAMAAGRVYANTLVGLPATQGCSLSRPVRIGLIDGPIEKSSDALRNVPIFSNSVLGTAERIGSADHATGIAALIASPGGPDTPPGFAPGAHLYSVIAFARNGGRDVARLENIAKALDWLVSERVALVNMSLAGRYNAALEHVIGMADAKGIILVAAAGNDRRAVAYPASDPRVIAVTAVDAARRLYRSSNSGLEVDFAAPGVDVLVPSLRGPAYRSGTSYAAAIAAGVLARELARGPTSRSGLIERLRGGAIDLGTAGKDALYGWGLIQATGC